MEIDDIFILIIALNQSEMQYFSSFDSKVARIFFTDQNLTLHKHHIM